LLKDLQRTAMLGQPRGPHQLPRCSSLMIRMVDLEQPHIWFEHCTICGGSFFDAGEFKDLAYHTVLDFFKDLTTQARK
jgi:Zn-finger nucleic acid-binding protein